MSEDPITQVPGVYHRRVGDVLVTALSDGYADVGYNIFRNFPEDQIKAVMKSEARVIPLRLSVNAYALRTGGKSYLVDCGSQDIMGPTCGRLPANLAAAGISPESIDAVLLTHIHPDHSNGLTDIATGRLLFPNATVFVHQADIDHWFDDEKMEKADERARRRYFHAARDQISPWLKAGKVKTFAVEGEVVPGVKAIPCVGHTPGHSGYLITSGSESLFIWGDAVQVTEVQLAKPETSLHFDTDPDQAVASRMRVIDMVLADDLLVAGMHIHFPGFGRLRKRAEGGYSLISEQWAFTV